MSEVFELPMIDHGRNNLVTDHRDETEAAIIAINAYDSNQLEIAELKIDLRKSKEFNFGLAQENHELKAMVNTLREHTSRYMYRVEARGREPITSIVKLLKKTPAQSLQIVKADAVKAFGNEIGLYDSQYDDQEYIEVSRYSIKEHIERMQEGKS
jgi:hypothetical protein